MIVMWVDFQFFWNQIIAHVLQEQSRPLFTPFWLKIAVYNELKL